jgi:dTDP-4-amino-4,6-dideoxygalactose transaminase
MNVAFLDLKAVHAPIAAELEAAVRRVQQSGWFILGPEVEAFEQEWADYLGARHCVSVGNGLDALVLALRVLGIGAGDEVIVPSHTFVATWLAVRAAGAQPVPVEVEDKTYNLTADGLEAAITPRTRAVMPVHLYGQPADTPAIAAVADAHGLVVIEDAAQAHGARGGGTRIGGQGRIACWSFYPGKNLGALGDAGAITTDDPDVARTLRLLRNYGSERKYVHEMLGVNSRLDEMQAAALRVKLAHLDAGNAVRASVAERYTAGLRGVETPVVATGVEPSWHLYVIRSAQRDALATALADRGVETLIHYPTPPHRQAAFAEHFSGRAFPVADAMAEQVLSLPIGPHLDDVAVQHVIRSVNEAGYE